MNRLSKYTLIALALPGLLIPALWYLAVPLDVLTSYARLSMGETEFLFEGLSKGLPFSITADRLTARARDSQSRGDPFDFACTSLQGRLLYGSVLSLSPEITFSCSAYGGRVTGRIGMRAPREIMLHGEEISVAEISFAARYGIRGKGSLSFDYRGSSRVGEMTFLISEASLESDLLPRGFPLRNFQTMRGILDVRGRGADIKSLTLESPGIFARIKGRLGDTTDLVIELMMDRPAELDPLYAKALEPYSVSPGYWSVPFNHSKTRLN